MSQNSVEQVIARHKAAFVAGDIDALLADYAPDAVMMMRGSPPLVGIDAIRQTYAYIFDQLFPPHATEVLFDEPMIVDDLVLLPFSATTATLKTVAGQDAFIVRDGRIVGQFAGGDIVPIAT